MEDIFAEVFYDLTDQNDERSVLALPAYRSLLRIYSSVIARTTNWFSDRPLGVLGRYLRAVLGLEPRKLTLITFNQDLALENALVQLPYHQRWCVDRGYGDIALAATPTARTDVARLPLHSEEACDHSVDIRLLKLHGSLNWQLETLAHDPSYNDLFPSRDAKKTIECVLDREVSVSLRRRKGKRDWRLWPVVVPPIYEKRAIIATRFSGLWREAAENLSRADRVTLIGYSAPQADLHASNLLRRGVREGLDSGSIRIVNPDPLIPGRIADMTGARSINWFRSLPEYTESLQQQAT